MILDDHVAAVRAAGDDDDGAVAMETRLRLRRSLERDRGVRRQLVSVIAAVAVLLAATASWALATGQLQKLWRKAETAPQRIAPRGMAQVAVTPPVAAPQRLVVKEPPPPVAEPTQPLAPVTVPVRVHRAAPGPIEVLYRKAHELHFHGGDAAAALAAWDEYLGAEPTGRFAVEARYNRGLCLVRLGRFEDARDALAPFARGEVEPAGYRREEAQALVERITKGLNGTR